MSAVLAVVRREFAAALDAPSAWVAAAVFALALQSLFYFAGYPVGDLRFPGLWAGGVASLEVLFAWLPPLYAILAPAFTMGAWAEERRSGTEELLLAWPLSARDAVLGKFLAAWALLVLVTLVAVLPVAVVVARLGPLDLGVVAGGAIGAVLLAGASVAIGLVVSACTREQLVAFLLAALVLAGLWSATLFLRVVPPWAAEWVHLVSPQARYLESAAHGVLGLADVVHHVALAGLALLVNWRLVEARRRG